jgi:hypothetical protein
MTYSPLITAIDTVRMYTSGPRLLVEVDIVMDPAKSLMATHDVAIPNRQVWKRPTIVNHHNDEESHEVAVVLNCRLPAAEPGRGLLCP